MSDAPDNPIEAPAHSDQQFSLMNDIFDQLIVDAGELLAVHDTTRAWAILTVRISRILDHGEQRQPLAVKILVAAAIRLAKAERQAT